MNAFLSGFPCHSGSSSNSVVFTASGKMQIRGQAIDPPKILWRAGVTMLFAVSAFLFGSMSPAWAMEDHSHHHGHEMSAHGGMATPEVRQPAEAGIPLPLPTAEEMAAAFPDLGGMSMQEHMGTSRFSKLMLDRLEWQDSDGDSVLAWEGDVSWGSELNRFWLSSEGKREGGGVAHLDSRFYGSHAFARWWEVTAGLRQLGGEGPDRTFAGIGIQGLAPYFFELNASAWLGENSRTAFALEVEYELLLSNRLVLQPRLEMNAWGKEDVEKGIGRGISDAALGLRLRYEVRREFAPYVGLEWSSRFGDTARMARTAGEDRHEARLLAGLRLWW